MTRPLILIAAGGILTAVVCLPLAAALHRGSDDSTWRSWGHQLNWSWLDGDDDGADRSDSDSTAVGTRDFTWDGGDRLELDIPADLHFKPAKQWHLTIRGEERVLDRLRVANGNIGLRHSSHRLGPIDVQIEGPALRTVAVNGTGRLELEGLKQDILDVAIRGNGSARASGSVDALKVSIRGSGSAKLQELAVRSVIISIAGSGDTDVSPSDSCEVFIAGSGTVRLHTHPKHTTSRVAGSGQIIEVSENATAL
jgi:hypothetical protein